MSPSRSWISSDPAFIIGGNFHHPAAETIQRLGFGADFSQLGREHRIADVVLNASRKRLHVGTGIGELREFLHALLHAYIGISRIMVGDERALQ